jgi:ATP-dependent RNA circularization protein (DNA/RNA ligase family)
MYWNVVNRYPRIQTNLPQGLALQMELVGPKFNGNRMKLEQAEARAFSLFDFKAQSYLPYDRLCQVCEQVGVPVVPVMGRGQHALAEDELRRLADVEYAKGCPGEGVVVRDEQHTFSFKVINLKYKD